MQFDPPGKFLPSKGEQVMPWVRWNEVFLTYMTAIDGQRMGAERKKSIFLHCLGSEGQVVFRSLPQVDVGCVQGSITKDGPQVQTYHQHCT